MLKTRLMILAASALAASALAPGAAHAQYGRGYGWGGGYGGPYVRGPGPRFGWRGYGWGGYPGPYGYGYPFAAFPRPIFVPAPYIYAPPPPVVYAPPPVYLEPRPVIRSHVVVRRPVVHHAVQPACLCSHPAPVHTNRSLLIGPLPALRPAPPPATSTPLEHGS